MYTTDPLDINSPMKKTKKWGRHVLGMVLSILCLVFIARKIDMHNLALALSHFQWPYLLYGLGSLAIGYSFRILRWALMLRAVGSTVRVSTCAAPFLGAIALNNVLPLRLGDLMRAFIFPSALGINKAAGASSLVMERLIDLMTLFACLMVGLVIGKGAELPEWLAKSVFCLVTLSALALILAFLFSGKLAQYLSKFSEVSRLGTKRKKWLTAFCDLLRDFAAMSRFRILLMLFALSVLVWVCESGLFWCLLIGFELETHFAVAMMVMAIATFSTLVPSSPGYIGPFHLAAFTAISMLGGTADQAASFAVLSHLALWIPTTLAGGLAMILTPQLFRGMVIKSNNKTIEAKLTTIGSNDESI